MPRNQSLTRRGEVDEPTTQKSLPYIRRGRSKVQVHGKDSAPDDANASAKALRASPTYPELSVLFLSSVEKRRVRATSVKQDYLSFS